MKPTIGFVLVTYNEPQQTTFLCRRLSEMFGDPPIAIHHDFSQSNLDRSKLPGNVSLVEPFLRTCWGSMTVVDAQIAAMRLLYATGDPDWMVTLSAADYPIQTAERILTDLSSSVYDAFFDLRAVHDLGERYVNEGLGALAFDHPRYSQGAFNRYAAIPLISTRLARKIGQPQEAWVCKSRSLIRRFTPFDGTLTCYGGDFWFAANRRVGRFLLEETPVWRTLYEHFKRRSTPEESFYHTLLGNTPGFRICPDNFRYTDWTGCYAHPRTLVKGDLPKLLRSTDHFARKFPYDPELFHSIDKAVANKHKTLPFRAPVDCIAGYQRVRSHVNWSSVAT